MIMKNCALYLSILLVLVILSPSIAASTPETNSSHPEPSEVEPHKAAKKAMGLPLLDALIIVAYFSGMLLIGWYYSQKTKNTDDYLLGGRNMKSWMVGLSFFATMMSTVTYFATPGEMIKHGPMILSGILAVPFTFFVVGWLLIPKIMKLKITSANELLELRFGLSIRILAMIFFLVLRLVWMAVVVYISVYMILGPILNIKQEYLPVISSLLAIVVMIYTSSGGIKAVVLTDVIQTFILFLGAILSIVIITIHFKGFVWFPTEWAPIWDPPRFWPDPAMRVTILGAAITGFVWNVCTAGADQMAIQRFLSTRNVKAARSSYLTNVIAGWLGKSLLAILGFGLLYFFASKQQQYVPEGMDLQENADQMFPLFIINHLPVGVTGLVLSGLLAAAMSSLSSGLSSCCLVISVDFFDRLCNPPVNERTHLRRTRIVSWSVGAAVVVLSLTVSRITGNLMEVVYKSVNLMVAPLFVLFFNAYFVPWANTPGVWAGAITSVATAVGIAFFAIFGLSFIWIQPCSLIVGIITASLVSLIFVRKN